MDRTRTHLLNLLANVGALAFMASPDDASGGGDDPKSSDGTDATGNNPKSADDDDDDDEPLGEPGIKALKSERLRAEQAQKRAKAAEARLKEIEDAEKTELEKAQERIAELEKTNQAYEAEKTRAQMRASVLASKNVPSEWADFVTGDSEDEMNKAADRIIANLSSADQGPALRPTSGQPGGSVEAGREAAKSFRP